MYTAAGDGSSARGRAQCLQRRDKGIESLGTVNALSEVHLLDCCHLSNADLAGCEQPTELHSTSCSALAFVNVSSCEQLDRIQMERCSSLTTLGGLGLCQALRVLSLKGCDALRSIAMPESGRVETIAIDSCGGLESIEYASSTARPQKVTVVSCRSLAVLSIVCAGEEETPLPDAPDCVPGSDCIPPRHVLVRDCAALGTVDLSSCTSITSIKIECCSVLYSINGPGKDAHLEVVHVTQCSTLATVDVSLCRRLRSLTVDGGAATGEEAAPSDRVPALQSCRLAAVHVSEHSGFHRLLVADCAALRDAKGIGTVSVTNAPSPAALAVGAMNALQSLSIESCGALKCLSGLPSSGSLTALTVESRALLAGIDLSCCARLETVSIRDCDSIASPSCLSANDAIKEVCMTKCNALRVVDVRSCSALRALRLEGCASLVTVFGIPGKRP